MVRVAFLASMFVLGAAPRSEREWIALIQRPGATVEDVGKASRALSVIGTNRSAKVLGVLLQRPDTREMARYALERIPGPAAAKALQDAMDSPLVDDQGKIGIAASLGRRRDWAAVPSLRRLLHSINPALAEAAAFALAEVGAIADVTSPHALLIAAGRMPAAEASAVYRRLDSPGQPDLIRASALRGLVRTSGSAARPRLLEALKSNSVEVQSAAIRELVALRDFSFAKDIPSMPALLQVRALAALSDAGDPANAGVFREAAGSGVASVRTAALTGLGLVGGPADVPLLADRAANGSLDERTAARLALARLKSIDEAVLASLATTTEPRTRIELIRAAGERATPNSAEVLLRLAVADHAAVRREAIRALRETAAPENAAAIVALVTATRDDAERQELARAAAAAIRRSATLPIDSLTASYRSAKDPETQAALLTALSITGSPQALPVLREALRAPDPDLRRAAMNALSEWSSSEPLPDLLVVAQTSPNLPERVLALRAYVRLVQLPSDRPPAETAKLLAAAMAAALRPEEKKLVLAAAARVFTGESLVLAQAAAADPAVAAEAALAVQTLERALSYRKK